MPYADQRNELLNAADNIMLQVRDVACGTLAWCVQRVHACAHVQSQFGMTQRGACCCSRRLMEAPRPLSPGPLSPLPLSPLPLPPELFVQWLYRIEDVEQASFKSQRPSTFTIESGYRQDF
jgi:hypothetical protein